MMGKPMNRVYCFDAGRKKFVFETEKKALTFIKFNSEDIKEKKGYAPIRAYYCPACMGWHVTHNRAYRSGITCTAAVVQRYRQVQEQKAKFKIERDDAVQVLVDIAKEMRNPIITRERVLELREQFLENSGKCKAKATKKFLLRQFAERGAAL